MDDVSEVRGNIEIFLILILQIPWVISEVSTRLCGWLEVRHKKRMSFQRKHSIFNDYVSDFESENL